MRHIVNHLLTRLVAYINCYAFFLLSIGIARCCRGLFARWIYKFRWSVLDIIVSIGLVRRLDRIATRPSPQPRRVIARSMVREIVLLVSLLACMAIPFRQLGLATHRLIRRTPIRKILLIRNDLPRLIQLQ